MSGRVFDDAVVEAAVDAALLNYSPRTAKDSETREMVEDDVRAALSAAADALEGAIRAEVLAPIVALVIKADAEAAGKMWQVAQVRADAIDSVIADPDAVAKHNAAIWDEGARAVINAGSVLAEMPSNPYRTTESS